jgi:hypothetical protein
MSDVLTQLRDACATIAQRGRYVRVNDEAIAKYAAALPLGDHSAAQADAEVHPTRAPREHLAAFWLALDAINFGSGWFPTLRKAPGRGGYHTIALGLKERFETQGPWTAHELQTITPAEVAQTLGQDPDHELMHHFARSLADLGHHVAHEYGGHFHQVPGASAVSLVESLARWSSFADVSTYDDLTIPFLKRAQIAAADLARAQVADLDDLDRLTMFADNLVPHVLRLDGILAFDQGLVERIERQQLIDHGSPEEVEIRACAVHAVELIVSQRPGARAADIDQLLWLRGQKPRYKRSPRHRSRCTAY